MSFVVVVANAAVAVVVVGVSVVLIALPASGQRTAHAPGRYTKSFIAKRALRSPATTGRWASPPDRAGQAVGATWRPLGAVARTTESRREFSHCLVQV